LPAEETVHGAIVEPRGCNRWQALANAAASIAFAADEHRRHNAIIA
jgi:hypothetical protein